MSYGLKDKVKEMILGMDASRQDPERPRDIGLRQFMAENYTDNDGNALAPEHLYAELDINPHFSRVKDVMAGEQTKYLMAEIVRDGVRRGMGEAQREQLARIRQNLASFAPVTADGGSQRFMSPEVFLDPVNRGAVQAMFYSDLVVREEAVSQPTATIPQLDLADARLADSGEAATIEEGSVTYGSKDVKLKKKAKGLKVTYEAIQFNSLSLAQIFFEDAGRILGHTLNDMAVDAIVDGDQPNGSEAAPVIGVEDPAKGITWFDLARIAIQFALLGRTGIQAIGNATTALNYINLDEVKNKQFSGTAMLNTMLKTPLNMPQELYVSQKVPDDQLAIQDPSMSLVQLTAMPLMVETERIISKQIQASYTSIMTGFAKLQRNASVILDGSIPFADNGFPAWMNPYKGE